MEMGDQKEKIEKFYIRLPIIKNKNLILLQGNKNINKKTKI